MQISTVMRQLKRMTSLTAYLCNIVLFIVICSVCVCVCVCISCFFSLLEMVNKVEYNITFISFVTFFSF